MHPAQVASLRRELITWLATPDAEAYYELMAEDAGTWRREPQREALVKAELFYVSDEMSAVAVHAGQTMPDQVPMRQEFPAEYGFIVWDGPLVDEETTATMLGAHPQAGLFASCHALSWFITELTNEEDAVVDAAFLTFWVRPEGRTYPPLIPYHSAVFDLSLPIRGSALADNEGGNEAAGGWIAQFDMTAYTTMVLMGQSVATLESHRPERAERRRAARAGLETPDVTVVQLRRHARAEGQPDDADDDNTEDSTEAGQDPAASARTHRWVVRGHWRQQWYPSLNDHRAIWIHGYVKGPEDKPLVIGERVNALLR